MKKMLIISFAFIHLFLLTACGNKNITNNDTFDEQKKYEGIYFDSRNYRFNNNELEISGTLRDIELIDMIYVGQELKMAGLGGTPLIVKVKSIKNDNNESVEKLNSFSGTIVLTGQNLNTNNVIGAPVLYSLNYDAAKTEYNIRFTIRNIDDSVYDYNKKILYNNTTFKMSLYNTTFNANLVKNPSCSFSSISMDKDLNLEFFDNSNNCGTIVFESPQIISRYTKMRFLNDDFMIIVDDIVNSL